MSVIVDPDAEWLVRMSGLVLVALDALAAAVLGTLLTLSALTPVTRPALSAPPWLDVALALVAAATVAARRFAPLWALGVSVLASVLGYALGFERDSSLTVALVLYLVATRYAPNRSVLALAASAVVTAAAILTIPAPIRSGFPEPDFWEIAGVAAVAVTILALGWALGVAVHRQRAYVEAVRVQAAQQVRAERDHAGRAAVEERLRIARELHDIVAHSMSVITVQAGVARYLLPQSAPETGRALEAIESTGRQALHDMRQLLGVLREDGGRTPHAPSPGLAELKELIARTDAVGTTVELSVSGEVRPLSEGVELCAYRIVQEALTNVVKHAATDHAKVRLVYAPEQLAIEVVDDGAGRGGDSGGGGGSTPGGGHGLIGMRERAALHGGTLEAGPLPVRGYRVAALLPLPPADENPNPNLNPSPSPRTA